ncbi:MAG: Spy/CpxP family protein refolding chaperone [Burkholderiales bacterium]
MKKSNLIGLRILVAASALLLQSAPVFAAEGMPPPGKMADSSHNFDWMQHTQHTLDELKGKLNLAPEQMVAWDTWSHGVLKDARQQLEQKKTRHEEEKGGKMKPTADLTVPEQMARGIAHLREETSLMQAHLTQLEAAQVRTQAFYSTLNTNQKTIFDLFWHEVYHRVAGHEGHEGWGMHGHEGPDSCDMMEGHGKPAGKH